MALDPSQLTRPGADPAVARNSSRAQDLILAKMAGSQKATAPAPVAQDLAGAAAGATQQAGQDVLKQTAAEVAQLKGQASNVAAQSATASAGQVGQMRLQRQQLQTQNETALANMDASTKKQLLDDRMNFQSSQIGVGTMQTSQLADWAVSKAKTQNEMADYSQKIQEATQKQVALYKQGYDSMTATLEADAKGQIQHLDEATKLAVTQAQNDFKLKWEQAQGKAAGQTQMFQGAGMIVGGIVGGYFGGPVGAAAGASVGGGVGEAVGSQAAGQQ